MVALLLGERADAIDKLQRLLEVGKLELAVKVVIVVNHPLGNPLMDCFQFLALQRRNPTAAWNAFLVSKLFGHRLPLNGLRLNALS